MFRYNLYSRTPVRLREDFDMLAETSVELKPGEEFIRLGQLLKYVGAVDRGSDVKEYLLTQPVLVDGVSENRRGAKIRPGQVVTLKDRKIRVCSSES